MQNNNGCPPKVTRRKFVQGGFIGFIMFLWYACTGKNPVNPSTGKEYSISELITIRKRNLELMRRLNTDQAFLEQFVKEHNIVLPDGGKPICKASINKLKDEEMGVVMHIWGECIACDACIPECPDEAINEGDPYYYIRYDICTYYEEGDCRDVCWAADVCMVNAIYELWYQI